MAAEASRNPKRVQGRARRLALLPSAAPSWARPGFPASLMPSPLSLSDDEYSAVMQAAGPIHPVQRDDFLRALAAELERHPVIGAGLVHRLAAELQHKFVVEARAEAGIGTSRYSQKRM
jgi:hypothetical protein